MKCQVWELQQKRLVFTHDGEPIFEKSEKSASHPKTLPFFASQTFLKNSSKTKKDLEQIAPSPIPPIQHGETPIEQKNKIINKTHKKSYSPSHLQKSPEGNTGENQVSPPSSTILESYNTINLTKYGVEMII